MKLWIRIGGWSLMVILAIALMVSLGIGLPYALVLSVCYVGTALACGAWMPQIRRLVGRARVEAVVYAVLTVVTAGVLFSYILRLTVPQAEEGALAVASNPLLILLVTGALTAGDIALGLLEARLSAGVPPSVTFTSERRTVTLLHSEILYIESNDDYVLVYGADGQFWRSRTAISKWEDILGDGFERIHRSYLVNASYVHSCGTEMLTMSDGTQLPVSRKYRPTVRSRFATLD